MQLELIHLLQTLRSNLLDHFFIGLNFFDTGAFFFLLIPAIWFGKSWRAGLRLLAIILLSSFAVGMLKHLFALPRPFHIMPQLAVIKVSDYGFPSGGATNAMLLSCLLLTYGKLRFKWVIALLFWFFVSLSRLYLGVHFLTDILGGWVLGLSLWAFCVYAFPPIENILKKQSRLTLLLLSQAIPISLFFSDTHVRDFCSLAMGITLSLFFIKAPAPKALYKSLLQAAIGAVLAFAFYLGLRYFFHPTNALLKFSIPFAVGLGIGVLGSCLCKLVTKAYKKKKKT
jgi:membrane-associated phospholipid phosphatase